MAEEGGGEGGGIDGTRRDGATAGMERIYRHPVEAGQRAQSSRRGVSHAVGSAGSDRAEDLERVELNQQAPRCCVARACRTFKHMCPEVWAAISAIACLTSNARLDCTLPAYLPGHCGAAYCRPVEGDLDHSEGRFV